MFGYLKGTNPQEGGAFLFYLKEDREDKAAAVKSIVDTEEEGILLIDLDRNKIPGHNPDEPEPKR